MAQEIKAQLFGGYYVTSEVRMHLNASALWKDAQLFPSEAHLVEMRYEDDYVIGCYLSDQKTTLEHLKSHKEEISKTLQSYCPKLEIGHLKFFVYSQVFVY